VKFVSLTLRDAQHLSWKTFKKFEALSEKDASSFGSGAELVKKAEAVAQKMAALQNVRTPEGQAEFGRLLSELLFAMFVLAERQGVSLEDSFLQAVDELILGFVS
jgi:hypothetical protein